MTATTPQSMTGWAQFLGVTLRPWAGQSPGSLIFKGLVQTGIAGALCYVGLTMDRTELALDPALESVLAPVFLIAIITVGFLLLTGVGSLIVGILDLAPRKTITGQVLSDRERKFGDFLPVLIQRAIWTRGGKMDKRKVRWEVVLQTQSGEQAFTVRKFAIRKILQSGSYVTVTYTPIAHCIVKAQSYSG